MTSLSILADGLSAKIVALHADDVLLGRLHGLGLRVGEQITMVRRAPFSGPLHVRIGMTDLVLRHQDAKTIDLA